MRPLNARAVASSVCAVALMGCSYEITQKVDGALAVDSRPASGVHVALVDFSAEAQCNEPKLTTITDSNGKFAMVRSAKLGRLDVLVQDDTLCLRDGDKWIPIWRSVYGPAPPTLTFSCAKLAGAPWRCKMDDLESMDLRPNPALNRTGRFGAAFWSPSARPAG